MYMDVGAGARGAGRGAARGAGGGPGGGAPPRVVVPVADGSEEMEAVAVVDVLRRAGAAVTVASVEAGRLEVDCSRGVRLRADVGLEDLAQSPGLPDAVVLPGGMPGAERLAASPEVGELLRAQTEAGGLVGAVCASPAVVLGPLGLLEGRSATAHPAFSGRLPDQSRVPERVVVDRGAGVLVTSRGPGTSLEFGLELVSQLFSAGDSRALAGALVMPTSDDPLLSICREPPAGPFPPEPAVLVPLAPGMAEVEAVIIIDVLRRAGARVVAASVGGEAGVVTGARGVQVSCDCDLSSVAGEVFDLIALPGGMPGAENLAVDGALKRLLRDQLESERLLGAICAAPKVVVEELAPGRMLTAYPSFAEQLHNRSHAGSRTVIDGNLVTGQGPGTTFEFALALVEILFGRDKRQEVAEPMVLWNFRESRSG